MGSFLRQIQQSFRKIYFNKPIILSFAILLTNVINFIALTDLVLAKGGERINFVLFFRRQQMDKTGKSCNVQNAITASCKSNMYNSRKNVRRGKLTGML